MNWKEFRFAFRTLPFLDSHMRNTAGLLELRARPARRLLIWHPEGVDWIFRADRQLDHVPSRTLSPLLGRESLLWADGPRHVAYRRVLAPRLHGHQLQAWHPTITETVHSVLEELAPGNPTSLIEWSRKVTLRIISHIVLNEVDSVLLETFKTCVDGVLASHVRTLTSRYVNLRPASACVQPLFLQGRQELGDMLLARLKTAMNTQPPALALAPLLLANARLLGVLDDQELVNQMVSLLFAGYETT